MLSPKKVKFRKSQKMVRQVKGVASRGTTLTFGDFGIVSLEDHWITARQIEAARVALTRYVKRNGRVWIRIFPDKPLTKKPAEVRMGKGKGAPELWVASVQAGKVLYEMTGVDEVTAKEALALAAAKLPVKTRFVTRQAHV